MYIYILVNWWDFYGNETPNLKIMAKMILGLTISSLGCERNWSAFEGVSTNYIVILNYYFASGYEVLV